MPDVPTILLVLGLASTAFGIVRWRATGNWVVALAGGTMSAFYATALLWPTGNPMRYVALAAFATLVVTTFVLATRAHVLRAAWLELSLCAATIAGIGASEWLTTPPDVQRGLLVLTEAMLVAFIASVCLKTLPMLIRASRVRRMNEPQ